MIAQIVQFPGGGKGRGLTSPPGSGSSFGGPFTPSGGGGSDGYDARIAKLETSVEHIEHDIREIKTDIREVRNNDIKGLRDQAITDFRWMLGLGIGAIATLAGMMAKGFHWF